MTNATVSVNGTYNSTYNSTSNSTTFDLVSILGYYPNEYAALAAAILFGLLSFFSLYFTIRTRTWFVLFGVFCCLLELIGYAYRYKLRYTPDAVTFIISQLVLIVTPIFLALVDYLVVGELLKRGDYSRDPILRCMRPQWISRIFTLSDVACFAIQFAGTIMSSDASTFKTGNGILVAGIFAQISFFSLFSIFALVVYLSPALRYRGNAQFKHLFIALLVTVLLIQARNVYRAIEFILSMAKDSSNPHEYPMYLFDFVPTFMCCALYTFLHYGFFLNPTRARFYPFFGKKGGDHGSAVLSLVTVAGGAGHPGGVSDDNAFLTAGGGDDEPNIYNNPFGGAKGAGEVALASSMASAGQGSEGRGLGPGAPAPNGDRARLLGLVAPPVTD